MKNRIPVLTCIVAGVLFLVGCKGNPNLAPVTGIVTLDGQPLADASLSFAPLDGSPKGSGITDELGKYVVYTYKDKGAWKGKHKVLISKLGEAPDRDDEPAARTVSTSASEDSGAEEMLPSHYNTETTLVVEVTTEVKTFDFDLKSE